MKFRRILPLKILNDLRAAYGLLLRFVKSGAFTMPIRIAMPWPIAADLYCTATVLAEAFPPGFIAGKSLIFHWFDYLEESKGLACKVMLELELGAAT